MGLRALFVILTFLTVVCDAAAYCSKPDAPYCASEYGAFDDEDDFDRCKSEMNSYQSEIEDFISCVNREIDDLKRQGSSAVDEYEDAVSSFNRRVQG